MRIGGMIFGSRLGLVRDGRTLNGMEKAGHFVRRDKYVDEEHRPRSFTWHGGKYRIEYRDGCFYPFVFKVE